MDFLSSVNLPDINSFRRLTELDSKVDSSFFCLEQRYFYRFALLAEPASISLDSGDFKLLLAPYALVCNSCLCEVELLFPYIFFHATSQNLSQQK